MGYYAYISELRKNTNIFPLVAENIINWSRINPTGLLIDFLRTEWLVTGNGGMEYTNKGYH